MFHQIIVPLDGSSRAEQALPVAARLARASEGTVILMQATDIAHIALRYGFGAPYIPPDMFEDEIASVQSYLERWRSDRLLAGINVRAEVVRGNPALAIIEKAAQPATDLVVLSSHGYTGMKRRLLGSVAEKVVRHSLAPVLVLRDQASPPASELAAGKTEIRALVPLDLSPRSQDVLVPAAALVAALSASGQGVLHLARIVVEGEVTGALEQEHPLAAASESISTIAQSIREGLIARFGADLHPVLSWSATLADDVAGGIVRLATYGGEQSPRADASSYDLVALTTHGASGNHHWPGGSITERVLHATRLPVLIVRPEDMVVKERQRRLEQITLLV